MDRKRVCVSEVSSPVEESPAKKIRVDIPFVKNVRFEAASPLEESPNKRVRMDNEELPQATQEHVNGGAANWECMSPVATTCNDLDDLPSPFDDHVAEQDDNNGSGENSSSTSNAGSQQQVDGANAAAKRSRGRPAKNTDMLQVRTTRVGPKQMFPTFIETVVAEYRFLRKTFVPNQPCPYGCPCGGDKKAVRPVAAFGKLMQHVWNNHMTIKCKCAFCGVYCRDATNMKSHLERCSIRKACTDDNERCLMDNQSCMESDWCNAVKAAFKEIDEELQIGITVANRPIPRPTATPVANRVATKENVNLGQTPDESNHNISLAEWETLHDILDESNDNIGPIEWVTLQDILADPDMNIVNP